MKKIGLLILLCLFLVSSTTYAEMAFPLLSGQVMTKNVYDADKDGVIDVGAGGGSGDVTGPNGAVAGNIPLLDVTGKILSDSGTKPADFLTVESDPTVDSSAKIQAIIGAGVYEPAGVTASEVTVNEIGTATYDDVQDWNDTTQSAGVLSGCTITDDGDGTITVAAGTGIIKSTNSEVGINYFFDLAQDTTLVLTDESINYVAVDYNSGTPQYRADATSQANGHTIFNLGKVYKEGTSIDIINSGLRIQDYSKRSHQVQLEENNIHFATGGKVSETGTLNIAVTSGVIHAGNNRITSSAIDTSVADDFEYYYYDGDAGPAVWVESDETAIDDTYYNNVATGLAELTVNKYGVHWVFKGSGTKAYVLYGQGNYSLSDAEAAQPPSSLPEHVEEMGILRAKIIVQKSDTSFTALSNVTDTTFSYQTASNHNELGGLQGGTTDEYYHLTSAQHTVAGNTSGINTGDAPGYYNLAIPLPNSQYANSVYIPIDPYTEGAITITDIDISCDSVTYDLDWDLMQADALIGMANSSVLQAVDTSSGVLSLSSQSIAVTANKAVYLRFNAEPNAGIKWVSFKAKY